jgi:hypothetical protein
MLSSFRSLLLLRELVPPLHINHTNFLFTLNLTLSLYNSID